jgi:hypothetical protein
MCAEQVKGSEDGEAETETCRPAKLLWRTMTRTSGPQWLNSLNRPACRVLGRGEQVTAPPIPIKNLKKSLRFDRQCAVTFAAARGLFARSANDRRNMIPAATAITK